MARPPKQGLDYFPHDVKLDDTVELLEAEFGLVGYAVLMKLYEKIYSESYFIQGQEEHQLLFARRINTELSTVVDVVNACFKWHLFDRKLHEKHGILTSKGIQKRYFSACKTARRKRIEFEEKYLLINKTELMRELTALMQEETPINSRKSTQRKEKGKRKEREIESIEKGAAVTRARTRAAADAPLKEIVELFNKTCRGYKPVLKISESREKRIRETWIEFDREMSVFVTLFEKAQASKFLQGGGPTRWTANFDWLMKPENMLKVLEGDFDECFEKDSGSGATRETKVPTKRTGFHLPDNASRRNQYSNAELEAILLNRKKNSRVLLDQENLAEE